MAACSDPSSDGTTVIFPTEAMGLGEVEVTRSSSGQEVEFRSTGSQVKIAGTVDPASFGVVFDLRDDQGRGIHCTGTLEKFTNPGGSEGMSARADCNTGFTGTSACRIDPPMNASLLIQRILPEGTP